MTAGTLRAILGIAIVLHGIGHGLALFPLVDVKLSASHSSDSWILNRLIGDAASRGCGVMLWCLALLAFMGGGFGLMGGLIPEGSWESWLVFASLVSLLALALFWDGLPFLFPNKLGVIAVDLALIVCILWLRWPGELFGG